MLVLDDDDLRDAIRRLGIDPARPGRYRLDNVIRRNFEALSASMQLRSPLQFAYSVKTNPDPAFLTAARAAGLYAEVIGPQELALAHEFGFANNTIYNGPYPAWQAGALPGMIFADSLEAFVENARRFSDGITGLRVRPAGIMSRFGVPHENVADAAAAIRTTGRTAVGVSFHVRPEDYAERTWRDVVEDALLFSLQIERTTRARVIAFNVGGGRTPLEFDRSIAAGDLAWLIRTVTSALPAIQVIFSEPGQAVATPCGIYVAPVLERRRHEVVVNAGYPELSQIRTFDHRVLGVFKNDEIALLPKGEERILGRTCLEYDVIRDEVRLPDDADALQAIVIADAGAYDYSMAFNFALGGNSERNDPGVRRS